jgi:adenylate kinase
MIKAALESNTGAKGFLFDGFPRTQAQAAALDKLLAQYKAEINVVLALEVSEEELVKRLLNRGLTSGRSDDAGESVVRARITEYHNKTAAVAAHYAKSNKVVAVEGEGTVDSIFASLATEIDERIQAS